MRTKNLKKDIFLGMLNIFFIVIFSVPSSTMAKKKKFTLKLDYTSLKNWTYVLKYHSLCKVIESDTVTSRSTRIGCTLNGKVSADKTRLTFTVSKTLIESDLYSDYSKNDLKESLDGSEYGLALINGCPVVDTLGAGSINRDKLWDIYIQFAKLLPDMPNVSVRKGQTWERSTVYPVKTNVGTVPCEVYRLYRVSKVSKAEGVAYVDWEFTYSAEPSAMKDKDILKYVPIRGKGTGRAVIDIIDGYIQTARVNFQTPISRAGDIKVIWSEDMLLEFKYKE